jgi:WD40-like Beta Propeller Repeat
VKNDPYADCNIVGPTTRKCQIDKDGKSLVYIGTRAGVSNLWIQPLDGGPPTQLTSFDSLLIYNFAFAPDGRLAITRGHESNDVVLISSVN